MSSAPGSGAVTITRSTPTSRYAILSSSRTASESCYSWSQASQAGGDQREGDPLAFAANASASNPDAANPDAANASASNPDAGRPNSSHPYSGRTAVLATKHEKLSLIGPPIQRAIGLTVEAVAVDTDVLGTFTADIPRKGTPLETAVAKARLGIAATGIPLGMASEGSIGPDPLVPFLVADQEIVVLVDEEAGVSVWETCSSTGIVTATADLGPADDLEPLLSSADFPNHRLIVRPSTGPLRPIHKGIDTVEDLNAAIVECSGAAANGLARVETDLRAHACPSRQPIIGQCALQLASRLTACCPTCGTPGWGRVDVVVGIPCSWCGAKVPRPRAVIYGCLKCDHRETAPLVPPDAEADPGECPFCNP